MIGQTLGHYRLEAKVRERSRAAGLASLEAGLKPRAG